MPRLSRSLLVLLLVLASACDLFRGSSGKLRSVRSAGTDAREAHTATVHRMVDRLAERATRRRDHKLDILLIGSGGQHGAYAAGFLRGWVERPAPVMPAFDLVAAVSSGALLAPAALLGTPEALVRGGDLFRTAASELAPPASFWAEMRRAGGVPDASEYRRLVERTIDAPLQAALREPLQAQRQIAIATTDFDLGLLRVWDFGHELGQTPRGRRRAHALLIASASVPGVFPPIMIDDHVHAAGDVFGSVWNPLTVDDYHHLVARLHAHDIEDPVTVRLYVIASGYVQPLREWMDPDDRRAMGTRAETLAFVSRQAQSLEALADMAGAVNGGVRGLRMELRITRIPGELAAVEGAGDKYHEAYAIELEQAGYARARGDDPWDREVVPRRSEGWF